MNKHAITNRQLEQIHELIAHVRELASTLPKPKLPADARVEFNMTIKGRLVSLQVNEEEKTKIHIPLGKIVTIYVSYGGVDLVDVDIIRTVSNKYFCGINNKGFPIEAGDLHLRFDLPLNHDLFIVSVADGLQHPLYDGKSQVWNFELPSGLSSTYR